MDYIEEISKHDNLYKFIAIFLLPASLIFQWFLLLWIFYILWYGGYYSRTNKDRKEKKFKIEQERIESIQAAEWEKQEKIRNTEYRIKMEQQERSEQIKKKKEQEYQKYFEFRKNLEKMPIYETWKKEVIKKCENKCQIDKSHASRKAEVHHIDSLFLIYKLNDLTSNEKIIKCKQLWDINNGIMLCKECHNQTESSKKRQSFIAEK